jgi:hypothetical protein
VACFPSHGDAVKGEQHRPKRTPQGDPSQRRLPHSQDTTAFLRVLYTAVERYGSPERLVTYGGGIFKATRSKSVYAALGIGKEEIERGKPYQSYIEATFNIQGRMADYHFEGRELAGAGRGARKLDGRLQRPEAQGSPEQGRRPPQARRRSWVSTPASATIRRTYTAPSSRPGSDEC